MTTLACNLCNETFPSGFVHVCNRDARIAELEKALASARVEGARRMQEKIASMVSVRNADADGNEDRAHAPNHRYFLSLGRIAETGAIAERIRALSPEEVCK